jgi:hypothetical protein
MANLRAHGILSEFVDKEWAECAPLIEKALLYADGKYTIDDIYKFIKEKTMQLWVGKRDEKIEIAFVTQIICYPTHKRLLMFAYAGDNIHDWLELKPLVTEYAKWKNCTKLDIYGRPGWERVLAPKGYKKIHTVLSLHLA